MGRERSQSLLLGLSALASLCVLSGSAAAQTRVTRHADDTHDGVYDRLDGDLDLGLGLGVELGSAGHAAPAIRGTAHYFSIAGLYLLGRAHAGDQSARSLFAAGVDLRPLFLPRWAKGFETGPSAFDLTLDSLSLSLGAFFTERAPQTPSPARGLEVGLGFGFPLFARASGLWLETRGVLRYPDAAARQEAVLVALAWHGFAVTPLSPAP